MGKKIHGSRDLIILTERKIRMTITVLIKSITPDNVLEFKALGLFGYQTGIDIYKCNPCASHERGLN